MNNKTLFEILKENNIIDSYIFYRLMQTSDFKFYHDFIVNLSAAFPWKNTNEGAPYWHKLDREVNNSNVLDFIEYLQNIYGNNFDMFKYNFKNEHPEYFI